MAQDRFYGWADPALCHLDGWKARRVVAFIESNPSK
jgi:hypothetical protein